VASTGNDANVCSLSLPCRSFGAALAQTAPAGEVIVLDSAGYGPVVITQSASIIAPPGVYAGVTVTGTSTSTSGIYVNAPGVEVTIRGLSINGQGGLYGIFASKSAKLTVEDSEIANLTGSGIVVSVEGGDLIVRNTVIRNMLRGIEPGLHNSVIDRVRIENCSVAGIDASGANVTITNSVLSNNPAAGVVAVAPAVGMIVNVMVSHSTVAGSADALVAEAIDGSATLIADGNTINNASHAAFLIVPNAGTATIYSSGTNALGTNVGAVVLGGTLTPIGLH